MEKAVSKIWNWHCTVIQCSVVKSTNLKTEKLKHGFLKSMTIFDKLYAIPDYSSVYIKPRRADKNSVLGEDL